MLSIRSENDMKNLKDSYLQAQDWNTKWPLEKNDIYVAFTELTTGFNFDVVNFGFTSTYLLIIITKDINVEISSKNHDKISPLCWKVLYFFSKRLFSCSNQIQHPIKD